MSLCQHLVCGFLFLQILLPTVSAVALNSSHYENIVISDVFTYDVISETSARSKLDCGRQCSVLDSCAFWTYLKGQADTLGQCRGHSRLTSMTSLDKISSPAVGAMTYKMTGLESDPPTPDTNWLEKVCATNSDCPAAQSECFKGKCLCTPGYYYSTSGNSCVASCVSMQLGSTLLKYPGCVLMLSYSNAGTSSEEQCRNKCVVEPTCASLTYQLSNGACHLRSVTPLQSLGAWNDNYSNVNYYQRTCQ